MAFVEFKHKERLGARDIVSLTKRGRFYFPQEIYSINKINCLTFNFLFDNENKYLIAFQFHKKGRFKLSKPAKGAGFYANSERFLESIGYPHSSKKHFNYKYENGLIIIDLMKDEILSHSSEAV